MPISKTTGHKNKPKNKTIKKKAIGMMALEKVISLFIIIKIVRTQELVVLDSIPKIGHLTPKIENRPNALKTWSIFVSN